MTIDPKDQRPNDSFTAQDGVRLFAAVEDLRKQIGKEVGDVRAQMASIQNRIISLVEGQARVEAGLSSSRMTRLELELRDAELEREAAEIALKKAEERLTIKQEVKDKTIDTQERIKSLTSNAVQDIENQKKAQRAAKIEDLKFSALKSLVTWGTVFLATAILGFIAFLIRLYLNSGGP